jgi:signal transduction histidine kinase
MPALDLQSLTAASIHELKNLLGQLTLSLDEIAQADCPEVADQVAGARFACRRIADRMVEILTLYKLDGGRQAFAMDAHSPADFLEDLQRDARSLAAGRLAVELDCAPDTPAFWFFDRELTQGALMNAVHNALQHARSRIMLAAQAEDGLLMFTVRDDGPGYPADVLAAGPGAPRVAHGGGKGTGLGLYFAHAVAAAHENKGRTGRVCLANGADGGAVFSLLLP